MMGARRMTAGAARALLAMALLVPPAAWAQVLVFRGGDDFVRTEGPWEVRDERLVFRDPGGRLFSVALREVDLPRSRELAARLAHEGAAALAGLVPAGPVADERELAVADIPDALKHRGEAVSESGEEADQRRASPGRGRPGSRRTAGPALPKVRRVAPAGTPPPSGRPGSVPRRPRRP